MEEALIRKLLGLAALCALLSSCNNVFYKLTNNDSDDGDRIRFIVIFNKNGGDREAYPNRKAVVTPATTVVTLPFPPQRTGYSFIGWNTTADGSGEIFTSVTTVTDNCTVYAQWYLK